MLPSVFFVWIIDGERTFLTIKNNAYNKIV